MCFEVLVESLALYESKKSVGSMRGRIPPTHPLLSPHGQPHIDTARSATHGLKTIEGHYRSHLTNLLKRFHRNLKNRARAERDGETLIRSYFQKAYFYGLRIQAGHPDTPYAFSLTPSQQTYLRNASAEEVGYFNTFLRQFQLDARLRQDPSARVAAYSRTLDGIAAAGALAATPDLTIIQWKVNPLAESCTGCLWLGANGPYTRENLPTTPRAGDTQCFSNCKCELVMETVSRSEYRAAEGRPRGQLLSMLVKMKRR